MGESVGADRSQSLTKNGDNNYAIAREDIWRFGAVPAKISFRLEFFHARSFSI